MPFPNAPYPTVASYPADPFTPVDTAGQPLFGVTDEALHHLRAMEKSWGLEEFTELRTKLIEQDSIENRLTALEQDARNIEALEHRITALEEDQDRLVVIATRREIREYA